MEWASGSINWATLSTLCLHSVQGESAGFQQVFKNISESYLMVTEKEN